MKKFISILLAVMLVVSVSVVSFGAYNSDGDFSKLSPGVYNPSDSYTVDAKTPYAEDVVVACGGSLDNVQTIYFQAPADWANEYNTFAGPDDSEPYMHVCVYWWGGIGSSWLDGTGVKWCGYQAHLIDKENRIYSAQLPAEDTPLVVWNNGVNAGMDKSAAIFKYGRQIMDVNIEGFGEGDSDTMPEGSPEEWNCDGLISIINYAVSEPNALTGFDSYGSDWYAYYGNGCYGNYATTSDHFTSRYENCQNPAHLADPDKYHPLIGDINHDKSVDSLDVLCIQRHLAKLPQADGITFDPKNNAKDFEVGDVDGDGYISIIDATRIQRILVNKA